jgi:hypothetical protein
MGPAVLKMSSVAPCFLWLRSCFSLSWQRGRGFEHGARVRISTRLELTKSHTPKSERSEEVRRKPRANREGKGDFLRIQLRISSAQRGDIFFGINRCESLGAASVCAISGAAPETTLYYVRTMSVAGRRPTERVRTVLILTLARIPAAIPTFEECDS